MLNNIKAKFLGMNYAEIPQEKFLNKINNVIEEIRETYPRYESLPVNTLSLRLDANTITTSHTTDAKELFLLDAEGKIGIRIGNQGISISVDGYIGFEAIKDKFKELFPILEGTLNVSHYDRIFLRNFNVFEGVSENIFKDIRANELWGKQSFSSLKNNDFSCSGAATRHEYLSNDLYEALHISSSIVMPGHSYLPNDEWPAWKLRGSVPVIDINDQPNLSIELSGISLSTPAFETNKKLLKIEWETVQEKLDKLHDSINGIYSDITVKA